MRIGINGLGRIGRSLVRALWDTQNEALQLAAINIGPHADIQQVAYALQYDSVMGTWSRDVTVRDTLLYIDGKAVAVYTAANPDVCSWQDAQVQVVLEATGRFTKKSDAQGHLGGTVQHVIICAPSVDADITVIPGLNEYRLDTLPSIISVGSCTTNAVVPLLDVLRKNVAICAVAVNSIHAYTNNQPVHDSFAKDPRKGRAVANNIIPTSSGVQHVLQQVMPDLAPKFTAFATRVPVPKVSLVDMAVTVSDTPQLQDLHAWFEQAAAQVWAGKMHVSHEPLVATDYYQSPFSVILDATLTTVQPGLVKLYGWYDNEWGYTMRVCDTLQYIAQKL